ncbi:MAG: glycosyltransferase family 2 protein [Proteobacteria bacterium]|nr:glycosyltransferase family 2 protein [Pseudomonadota bacterium]
MFKSFFILCVVLSYSYANTVIDASVYVVCKNEEKHIKRLLENVKDFKEVILVDSGSEDKTLDIAKTYSNVKIYYHEWQGYAKQKAYALSLCSSKWVLNLDADEAMSDEMRDEIKETIKNDDCDGINSTRQFYYLGKKPHRFIKYVRNLRFFKKEKGSYDISNKVHEGMKIKGVVKNGKGVFVDYGTDSITFQMQKQNEYSSLSAEENFEKGERVGALKLAFKMPLDFLKYYFLRRHFLDGLNGFIYSVNAAYYGFLKYAKIYELQKTLKN